MNESSYNLLKRISRYTYWCTFFVVASATAIGAIQWVKPGISYTLVQTGKYLLISSPALVVMSLQLFFFGIWQKKDRLGLRRIVNFLFLSAISYTAFFWLNDLVSAEHVKNFYYLTDIFYSERINAFSIFFLGVSLAYLLAINLFLLLASGRELSVQDSFGSYFKIGFLVLSGVLIAGINILLFFFILGKYVLGFAGRYAWFDYMLIIVMLGIPSFIFLIGYPVFIKRTHRHRFAWVRWLSYFLFAAGIASCLFFWSWDIYELFKMKNSIFAYKLHTVSYYHSFSEIFIGGNIACFFLVGILQAFTNEKEKNWMDKEMQRSNIKI